MTFYPFLVAVNCVERLQNSPSLTRLSFFYPLKVNETKKKKKRKAQMSHKHLKTTLFNQMVQVDYTTPHRQLWKHDRTTSSLVTY